MHLCLIIISFLYHIIYLSVPQDDCHSVPHHDSPICTTLFSSLYHSRIYLSVPCCISLSVPHYEWAIFTTSWFHISVPLHCLYHIMHTVFDLSATHDLPICVPGKRARPPDKSVYLKIVFLISQPKHMLWVLKRTISMRWFF